MRAREALENLIDAYWWMDPRPLCPGETVMKQPQEVREKLSQLKSDDLTTARADRIELVARCGRMHWQLLQVKRS